MNVASLCDAAEALLAAAYVGARPTYGYRRVTALLNRELRLQGKPTVNAKQVLRIMQHHGLRLKRHTA
ncbi:hypothetical protein GGR04_004514 [Aureimonas pseudogalii]|uniref:HTH-like domain-containing protein n=1 Tax=Aureimonas pseudogalii TaxID=1744844 RepID=A0A7W6MMC2_9HYPH|nr:hypothetical protein [Aureimonas pseudogalii]